MREKREGKEEDMGGKGKRKRERSEKGEELIEGEEKGNQAKWKVRGKGCRREGKRVAKGKE